MPIGAPPPGRASIQDLQPLGSSRRSSIRIVVSRPTGARLSAAGRRQTPENAIAEKRLRPIVVRPPRRVRAGGESRFQAPFHKVSTLGRSLRRTDEICSSVRWLRVGARIHARGVAERRESQHLPHAPAGRRPAGRAVLSQSLILRTVPGQTGLPDCSRDPTSVPRSAARASPSAPDSLPAAARRCRSL
jgi:hypothetical protein